MAKAIWEYDWWFDGAIRFEAAMRFVFENSLEFDFNAKVFIFTTKMKKKYILKFCDDGILK